MKLYVWNNPYHVSYGGSFLYVVAKDLRSARVLADKARVIPYGDCLPRGVLGTMKLGKPTRVLELPCAEIYEWSE